jgi:hypothetical protein
MEPSLPVVAKGQSFGERLAALADDIAKFTVTLWDKFERLIGRAPPVQGFVDALFQGEVVVGWVRDPGRPERRLEVAAYQGEKILGSAIADLPRKDLVAANYGDGRYGFRLRLREAPNPSGGRIIRICALTERGRIALQRGIIALPEGGQPSASHEGPPIFIGVLERIDGSTVHGWAYNPDRPESAAIVDIYDDERFLGCATADRARPKLLQQGLSTSARGFSFDLQEVFSPELIQRLRARVAGTAFELTKSRNFLEGPPSDPTVPAGADKRTKEPSQSTASAGPFLEPSIAVQGMGFEINDEEYRQGLSELAQLPRTEFPDLSIKKAIGRPYVGKPSGLLLISGNARAQDTAASAMSWFGQSATASIAIMAGDVRQEISQLLPENRRDRVRWIDKSQNNALRDFLSESEFVVLARAGDAFNPDLAFILHHLADIPDVVLWNDRLQSSREARFETYLLHPPVDGFAVRANILSQYPGAFLSEAQLGRLHPLRLWLAQQADLVWTSIEQALERQSILPATKFDGNMRSSFGRLVVDQPWRLREASGNRAPTMIPVAAPERMSLALWRGWEDGEIKIFSDTIFDLRCPVQALIPTGGNSARGEERRAAVDRIALRSGAKQIYTKLVDCPDDPSVCIGALLDAADSDVVLYADAQLDLASTDLNELLAWSLCEPAGVVTTLLNTDLGPSSNAGLLSGEDINPPPPRDNGEAQLVDVVFGDLAAVSKQKAIAAGGFNGAAYGAHFQWLEFCLRLRQSGYYSLSLSHLTAGLAGASRDRVGIPIAVRNLLRSSHLMRDW